MRFTIITFRLQVLRPGGVTVCVGVCGHLNCNLRRQSGVSRVALVRGGKLAGGPHVVAQAKIPAQPEKGQQQQQ